MSKEVRIGIIGCGNIVRAHLNGLKELKQRNLLEGVRIVALCNRTEARAQSFVKKGEGPEPYPGAGPSSDPMNAPHVWISELQDERPEVFTDYKQMIDTTDVNTVLVCTPVSTHYDIGMYAMSKGIHVFLEKPMAVSVKAGRALVEKAKETGVTFGVAENFHYLEFPRLKSWAIEQGYIGDATLSMQMNVGGFYAPDLIVGNTAWRHKKLVAGGGITSDACVHGFHVLRMAHGEIEYVNGETRTVEPTRVLKDEDGSIKEEVECETDDTMACTLIFENGLLHHQLQSWGGRGDAARMPGVAYGTKGCINGSEICLDDGTRLDLRTEFDSKASQEVKDRFFPHGITDSFALENLDFLNAIQNGGEPEMSGEEGLKDMAVSYAVLEASYTGRRVKFSDVLEGSAATYEKDINEHYGI
jgi:predicted dehydrogenase